MNKPKMKLPPSPPEHFTGAAPAWARAGFVCYALGLAFLPGLFSYLVILQGDLPTGVIVPAVALLSVIAGFGFYVIGHIGHEGFHFTLAKSKWVSGMIGTIFSSAIVGFSPVGFYLVHSRHHRHTNEAQDPDYQLFSTFRKAWRRLALLRVVNNRQYMKLLLRMVLKGELPQDMKTVFTIGELKKLGWVNVAALLCWMTAYATAFVYDPWLFLCLVVFPHAATAVISAAIVFAQHAGTGNDMSNNARTHDHPIVTVLMAGTNYHLEHHLYPRVPCWRLRELHSWLRATPWAAANPLLVERSFWGGFMLFRTRFAYGGKRHATG